MGAYALLAGDARHKQYDYGSKKSGCCTLGSLPSRSLFTAYDEGAGCAGLRIKPIGPQPFQPLYVEMAAPADGGSRKSR